MKNRKLFINSGCFTGICFGLIVLGCLAFPVAAADQLYGVDTTVDKLVIIDTASFGISEVGSLGVDISGADAIVPISSNELLAIFVMPNDRYEYYKINSVTGQATWLAHIITGFGNPDINFAESLSRNPGTGDIYIGYSSGLYSSTSDLLGKLNPTTGEISPVCPVGFDMDSIEFSPDGSVLYANDVYPESHQITQYFYSVNPATCTHTLIKTSVTPNQFITDMELLSNGDLVGLEKDRSIPGSQELVKINTLNGDLTTLGEPRGYSIVSLSLKTSLDPSTVPEFPSTFLPAAMIIGFLGAVLIIQRTREY